MAARTTMPDPPHSTTNSLPPDDYTVSNERVIIGNKAWGAATQITLTSGPDDADAVREVVVVGAERDRADDANAITVVGAGADTVTGGTSCVIAADAVARRLDPGSGK